MQGALLPLGFRSLGESMPACEVKQIDLTFGALLPSGLRLTRLKCFSTADFKRIEWHENLFKELLVAFQNQSIPKVNQFSIAIRLGFEWQRLGWH